MRVTTAIWVSALLRRCFAAGGFAAVVRHGAEEAGAIFIVHRARDGTHTLFGPAPQAGYDDYRPGDRLFQQLGEGMEEAAVAERLGRETRFDPDLWIVEIEAGPDSLAELIPAVSP